MSDAKKIHFVPTELPSFEITVTGDDAKAFHDLFPQFDVYETVGKHCSICHKPFTRLFFDNDGTLKQHSDFWAHDYCMPSES